MNCLLLRSNPPLSDSDLSLLSLPYTASAATLPEVLRSYILSRPELYHQVLTYEPVWLESLLRDVKNTGVKLKRLAAHGLP